MEEYKDEKAILKRQMQEMKVSSGTGLLDLEHSTRCRQLRFDFDTSAKRQERPHTRTQQSMQNRHNNSRKEESEQQQGVKTVHQQLPSSPVCFKSNTLQPCLRKLFLQKTYWKGVVVVWGFVRCSCVSANSLCRKSFERAGVCCMFFALSRSQQEPAAAVSRSQQQQPAAASSSQQ